MSTDAFKDLMKLMDQRQEIEGQIRAFKRTESYKDLILTIVDRAPTLVSVKWTAVRRRHILD